jgi:hypothetical protein
MPPDDTIVPVPDAVVEPVVAVVDAVDPVAGPVPDEPELALEPQPDPAPPPSAPKWALERIGEETNKRQAAEELARQNAERASSYEEIIKRLQTEPKPAETASPTQRPAVVPQDRSAVEQEAAQIVFKRDMANISETGAKAYGMRWNDAVQALDAYGANSTEFVGTVVDVVGPAKAHELMFQISQDPEKAVLLAKMPQTRRVAEITRMFDAMAEPKLAADPKPADPSPKPAISRAPAPKPAVAPHAAAPDIDPRTPEGDARMSDSEWEVWYKSTYLKRTG